MCACVVVTVLMCVGALLGGSYGSDKANPKPAGDRVVCFMALSKELRSRPKLQAAAVHKLTRAGTATTKRKFSGLVWALAACGTDMAQAGLAALLDGLSAELVRLALWESSGEEFSEAGGAGPTKEWIDARIGQETRMISIVLRSLVQLTRPSRILWEALARTWTTFAQFTSSEILRVRDEVGDCVSNDNAGLPSRPCPPVLIRHAVVLQSLLMLGVVGHKAPVGSRMYREAYRLIQAEFAAVMPLENEQEAERRRYRELADEVFHKMDPRQQQGWRDLVRSGALLRVGGFTKYSWLWRLVCMLLPVVPCPSVHRRTAGTFACVVVTLCQWALRC